MPDELANDRAHALALARRYFYDRSVTADVVAGTFADTTDPLIARLVAMIVHEPARSGRLITISQWDYERDYWPHVAEVLHELEQKPAGGFPAPPAASMRTMIGAGIALLFVLLAASSDLSKFASYRLHHDPLWMAVLYLCGGLFMCVVAFVWVTRLVSAIQSRRRGTPR